MNKVNNKEDITLIWFDTHMEYNNHAEQTKKQLHEIVDYVVFYTELESCISFIESIHNEKLIFVISIYDASRILPYVATLTQLDSIFVCNWEKTNNEHLICEHSKMIAMYNELKLLCLSIREQVDFLDRHLQIFDFFDQDELLTRDLSKQASDLLWFQLYHDVVFQLTHDEEAKKEMIDACRSYYQDNIKELEVIEKFKNEYRSHDALQ
ncbi:unnamed protein product [Rotaria sp. Silwood2]|nr:unnamed protein product [Rotaria sp. Silwood2]